MIRNCTKHVFACAALLLKPAIALAWVSGELRLTTDYAWRGYSKSAGGPAVQLNLDYERDNGFFAGVWTSSVDFNDKGPGRARVEIVPYVGWNWPINEDWRTDGSVSRYFYDGKLFGQFSDYSELNAQLHFRDLVSARVGWSDDFYHRGHSALNYELKLRYPFTDTLQASTAVGFSDTTEALQYSYLYWNAGVSWFFKHGSVDLRYVQVAEYGQQHGPHPFEPKILSGSAVFSLSLGF